MGHSVRLLVLSGYSDGNVRYDPNQVIDVPDDQGEMLLRYSPGSFLPEIQEPVPAKDRMQRGGRVRA